MVKCENCEREYDAEFSFCPYCGEEKKERQLTDEERVKKVLPILKESFEDVATVGVESVLLKLDEHRSLLVNGMEKIETLSEKIEEALYEPIEETSEEFIPEIVREDERIAKRMEKRRDIIQAFSLITLCAGAVAIVLGLVLPFLGSLSGIELWLGYIPNTFRALSGEINLSALPVGEVMRYISCWGLLICAITAIADQGFVVYRLVTGRTKGRFYFLPTISVLFGIATLICANIAEIAQVGAYVLCIFLFFRILIGFFMPRTRGKIR